MPVRKLGVDIFAFFVPVAPVNRVLPPTDFFAQPKRAKPSISVHFLWWRPNHEGQHTQRVRERERDIASIPYGSIPCMEVNTRYIIVISINELQGCHV
jgi:hypothetical protein